MIVARRHRMVLNKSSRRRFLSSLLKRRSKMLTGDPSKKAHELGSVMSTMRGSSRAMSLKRRSKKLTGDPSKKAHEPGSVEKMLATRSNLRAYVCVEEFTISSEISSLNLIFSKTYIATRSLTHSRTNSKQDRMDGRGFRETHSDDWSAVE